MWAFFYVGKDIKIKYVSSNFSLYLYHMECFPLFSKLWSEKNCAKAKYLKSESSLENYEHFILVSVFGKWRKILVFKTVQN